MSYTATNLLFEMGPGVPVQDEEVDSHWVTDCACCSAAGDTAKHDTIICRNELTEDAAAGASGGRSTAGADVRSASVTGGVSDTDDVALSLDCAEPAGNYTVNKAARQSSQSEDCEAHSELSRRSAENGGDDSPPFLMYKWPKGVRGWSIIALLIGQAGPCIAILATLVIGKAKNMPELYLEDPGERVGLFSVQSTVSLQLPLIQQKSLLQ
jgi:hypothetical protein